MTTNNINANQEEALFNEVKLFLGVTWIDEDYDITIRNYISEAKYFFQSNDCAGYEIDFDIDLNARRLLKEYCRYLHHHKKEYFKSNFNEEILSLILEYAKRKIIK